MPQEKATLLLPVTGMSLEMSTLPGDDRPVYLTGTFNGWSVADERFRLQGAGDGRFVLHFPPGTSLPFPFEYKYTRGNWDSEELDGAGNAVNNRIMKHIHQVVRDQVPRWRIDGRSYKEELLPERVLFDEMFPIPQLRRHRKVQVLLPWDYHTSRRRYPVLYLQDGQNLFDEHAPFGNWGIDRQMAFLAERGQGDVIIVTVDHASHERILEYSPYTHPRFGKGRGNQYVKFKAQTLKPRIDKAFRTLPSRNHTGVGGSSMGGFISAYAGLKQSVTFGRMMIFSPSLWVSPKIFDDVIRYVRPGDSRWYLYAGGCESREMIPSMRRLHDLLMHSGGQDPRFQVQLSTDPRGRHHEARWGEEFPKAVEWLMAQG